MLFFCNCLLIYSKNRYSIIFSLIFGLIFQVFVILQIFFDGWFESRNTEKMWILENFEKFKNFVFFQDIDSGYAKLA